jgi:hypothetical protein
LLYKEQAEFLREIGFRSIASAPAIWVKKSAMQVTLVLQYSDDFLVASTSSAAKAEFHQAISERFDIEWQEVADWYLQARITQD